MKQKSTEQFQIALKGLGEKARSVAEIVTKRAALNAAALALLVSSGCSNIATSIVPTATIEPTPISTSIEAVKTPEKEELTDVEFVSNLLGTYLNLDADPQLKKLKDPNYLGSQLSKFIEPDLRFPERPHEVPLGEFNVDYSDYDMTSIRYAIRSAALDIVVGRVMQGEPITKYMGFYMDEAGNIGEDSRISKNEPWPGRDEAARLVLSGTRNVEKFLRVKPNTEWSIHNEAPDPEMSTSVSMISKVVLPNGESIIYRVSIPSGQALPLIVGIDIKTGK